MEERGEAMERERDTQSPTRNEGGRTPLPRVLLRFPSATLQCSPPLSSHSKFAPLSPSSTYNIRPRDIEPPPSTRSATPAYRSCAAAAFFSSTPILTFSRRRGGIRTRHWIRMFCPQRLSLGSTGLISFPFLQIFDE